jgi:pyruvate kinase
MMQGMVSTPHHYRRTKIVATFGPSIASERVLQRIIRAGVDVFRLNFSHGTHEQFAEAVPMIRRIANEEKRVVAVMQDIQGPRIRTGTVVDGAPVRLEESAKVVITDSDEPGTATHFTIAYPRLADDIRPGHRILIADGTIVLNVERVVGDEVHATVINGGVLGAHKGVNLPDTSVSTASLTEKDLTDLAFGAKLDVDYVALSFVRRADDVLACRRAIARAGGKAPIISKIEHPQGIANLEEILTVSDGVMVARGDLGVELSPEKVPLLQKRIIQRANDLALPVITATQMLESMVQNPIPTRAEASDVANAILDGTDAVMLSGETAVGAWPVETVQTMARIAQEAERAIRPRPMVSNKQQTPAMARAARTIAEDLEARAMIVFTQTGHSAKAVSHVRPRLPVYAFTPDERVCRALALWYGVSPVQVPDNERLGPMIATAFQRLREIGAVDNGDQVVFVGSAPRLVGGLTNMIAVYTVEDR